MLQHSFITDQGVVITLLGWVTLPVVPSLAWARKALPTWSAMGFEGASRANHYFSICYVHGQGRKEHRRRIVGVGMLFRRC